MPKDIIIYELFQRNIAVMFSASVIGTFRFWSVKRVVVFHRKYDIMSNVPREMCAKGTCAIDRTSKQIISKGKSNYFQIISKRIM